MLRELLRILEKLSGKTVIPPLVHTARARTCDRVRPHAATLRLDERLRRRTNDLDVTTSIVRAGQGSTYRVRD